MVVVETNEVGIVMEPVEICIRINWLMLIIIVLSCLNQIGTGMI